MPEAQRQAPQDIAQQRQQAETDQQLRLDDGRQFKIVRCPAGHIRCLQQRSEGGQHIDAEQYA